MHSGFGQPEYRSKWTLKSGFFSLRIVGAACAGTGLAGMILFIFNDYNPIFDLCVQTDEV